MIVYKKMSLFDAPPGSTLVHACNANAVWGAGIAKEMKERFPYAYHRYEEECKTYPMIGEFTLDMDNSYWIASLITSDSYGSKVDNPEEILVHTTIALNEFCRSMDDNDKSIVYSNKFNSGLFKVPWERTEAILKVLVKRYNIDWIVCEQG